MTVVRARKIRSCSRGRRLVSPEIGSALAPVGAVASDAQTALGAVGTLARRLMMSPALVLGALGAALLGAAAGCGGAEPAPETPPPAQAPPPRPARRAQKMSISGELGSLDQGEVDRTFQSLFPEFSQCLNDGSNRVEFIGGHVRFFVRIGTDGRARYAYLPESDIGDREVEKCMLDKVKGAKWPAPIGGEGQAQDSLDFDPPSSVRPPVGWSSDRVAKALAKAHSKFDRCKAGGEGHFRATVYVQTDGTVLAAGVATPDEKGEQAADCLVEVIRGMKLPSPGSWPAKVSFDIE